MRQPQSPWNHSYDIFKRERRREQERTKEQRKAAVRWDKGFTIHHTPPERKKLHPDDIALGERRRAVDDAMEAKRLRNEIKEIWE